MTRNRPRRPSKSLCSRPARGSSSTTRGSPCSRSKSCRLCSETVRVHPPVLSSAPPTEAHHPAVELEILLKDRQEEIIVLRGEVGGLSSRVLDTEEQNKALREENALAFTKIHKKLESSATSDGYAPALGPASPPEDDGCSTFLLSLCNNSRHAKNRHHLLSDAEWAACSPGAPRPRPQAPEGNALTQRGHGQPHARPREHDERRGRR